MKITAYIFMLIFDFLIIAAAAYLVDQRGWSKWTMLLSIIVMAGSNPGFLWKKDKENES